MEGFRCQDKKMSVCVHAVLFQPYRLCVTLSTAAPQAPLSVGFSRQEYWSGCHASSPGIFLTQRVNPSLLCLLSEQEASLPLAPGSI